MKENKFEMEIDYDKEGDVLEIFLGKPGPAYYDEVADDLFEGHDKKTGTLKGYKIFNLTKRGKEWVNVIKLPSVAVASTV